VHRLQRTIPATNKISGIFVVWIPGWESITNAGWWSGFYFWASIVSLIGLGVAEVASHRYGERKDELAAVEQEALERRHNEEMTRVQHDTALANERATQLEKDAAALAAQAAETEALVGRARRDAAKANERAAELEKEAELARASIAEANARAAEANRRAEEAALLQNDPRDLLPVGAIFLGIEQTEVSH
jgi:hypothetical protein